MMTRKMMTKKTGSFIGRGEWVSAWILLILAGSVWGIIGIADVVREEESSSIDQAILLSMRSPEDIVEPRGPKWFKEMGRDLTALGGTGVLVLVIVTSVLCFYFMGEYRRAVILLVAVAGALLLTLAFKKGLDRARPELVPDGAFVTTQSLPSGHAAMAATTYLTLGMLVASMVNHFALRALFLSLSIGILLIVGLSRIYLGVHWPTDVLAGWVLASAWVLSYWAVVARRWNFQ
jgi:undecaprenyl-diphosphatase